MIDKLSLYSIKYTNKHYNKEYILDLNAENALEARTTAFSRVQHLEKDKYSLEDFTCISVDNQIIDEEKTYKTRDGNKVTNVTLRYNTNSSFEVSGNIVTPREGKSDKIQFAIWNINGRFGIIGESFSDLVEDLTA